VRRRIVESSVGLGLDDSCIKGSRVKPHPRARSDQFASDNVDWLFKEISQAQVPRHMFSLSGLVRGFLSMWPHEFKEIVWRRDK
jgi:hypothetical protein